MHLIPQKAQGATLAGAPQASVVTDRFSGLTQAATCPERALTVPKQPPLTEPLLQPVVPQDYSQMPIRHSSG